MERIFRVGTVIVVVCIWLHLFCGPVQAFEAESYRLLSISKSERLVLISRVPDQRRFLLDAADVKITINDKPAEFEELAAFTIIRVEMELGRVRRQGFNLDGRARAIIVSDPNYKHGEGE